MTFISSKTPFDLSRFIEAHERMYTLALSEIKRGNKNSHWIWFIFPQIRGLGRSPMAMQYAISGLDEARAFLEHEYLGAHLREICGELLKHETNDPLKIMTSSIDVTKLKSSMTLFAHATEDNALFLAVLDKYYGGKQDGLTLHILGL